MLLADIKFVDHPELRIDEHESTEMPFRYMADEKGMPIMPDVSCPVVLHRGLTITSDSNGHDSSAQGMMELIQKDSEKGFGDLL